MAKRTIIIKADDGQISLTITAKVNLRSGLFVKREMDSLTVAIKRRLAKALEELPYNNFGIDNITVK
jgi:hypothetical protein